jgi:thioredoxin 1
VSVDSGSHHGTKEMSAPYEAEPARETVESMTGPAVLDFGTNWCGFCQAAQPVIESGLAGHPQLRHLKIEDGKGRPLGRLYGVKLWPTLIFLRDGKEMSRVIRPTSAAEVREAMTTIG